MRRLVLLLLFILLAFGSVLPVNAQWGTPPKAEILSPFESEALQGVISIIGSTNVEGALAWTLSFSYPNDPRETWFTIQEGDQTFKDEILAQWDTTTLTDGVYQLRLRVHLEDNETSEALIANLRVRNYTIIETSTPTLVPTPGPLSTIAPTATSVAATPTPLPHNPAEISESDIRNSLAHGALIAFALIALIGLYASIRKKIR